MRPFPVSMHRLLCRAALAFLTVLLVAGCGEKSEPATAARQFLEGIAAGKLKEAYDAAAFGFRAQQTLPSFETRAGEMALRTPLAPEIGAPVITGDTAKLDARVVSRAGAATPLVVTLHREAGAWRVYSLKSPRSLETGLSENRFTLVGQGTGFHDATSQPLPDAKSVRRLIQETMTMFSDALQQRSFAEFYENVSVAWQKDLTQKQLQRAFQDFIDKGVNLQPVATLDPILDGPAQMTSDGLLLVSGRFPTQPLEVHFAFRFIYELPAWKLFGIDVNLQKVSSPADALTPVP